MEVYGNIKLKIDGLTEIYEFKIHFYCTILKLPDYCIDILKYLYNIKEEKSLTDLCTIFAKQYNTSKEIIRRKLKILTNNFIIGMPDRYKEDGTRYKTCIINDTMINNDNDYNFFIPYNDYSSDTIRREYKKESEKRIDNIVKNKEHRGIKNAGGPVDINKDKDKNVILKFK